MDQYTLYLFIPCFMFVVDTTVENWTSGRKMASPKACDFCYTNSKYESENHVSDMFAPSFPVFVS
jgi:hypothetical protein